MFPQVLLTIQSISVVEQARETRIAAGLEQVLEKLCTDDREQVGYASSSMADPEDSALASATGNVVANLPGRQEPSPIATTQLCIRTSLSSGNCNALCACQCHIRIRRQSPRWMSAILGTLFYSASINPALDARPCNVSSCKRSKQQTSVYQFTYYFPTWLARLAITGDVWNNLHGANSSWTIRMPRTIPDGSLCWFYIDRGEAEEIQRMLSERQMSPFDVDEEGTSVLLVRHPLIEDRFSSILSTFQRSR